MSRGRLHENYSFQKREDVNDGYGNTAGQWEEQFRQRGERKYFRGIEKVIGDANSATQRIIVKVRRSTQTMSVLPGWRFVDTRSKQTYNVRAIEPMDDRMHVEFIGEAGVNDG